MDNVHNIDFTQTLEMHVIANITTKQSHYNVYKIIKLLFCVPMCRASKSPDFSGDLPIFDKIMKISRSPDLE